jgi:cellulose synthase/poly-beta-1,6-N-acetylglucosamine synthase-like glycosyltransferase
VSSFEIFIVGVYACVLLVWVARHFVTSLTYRATPLLTPHDPGYRSDPPLVSVLIPAKDEESSIADCVLSVLHQSYLRLEVLVVDDRSEDGTANVVRGIAAQDPRVRLISVNDLPVGWTGKNNALVTGAREARGDWLLFVDSDTRHEPENLSVLMEYARREQADMVSVLPRWRNGTFWERVAQPLAALLLILKSPPHRVNNDADRRTAFANGQYILVRRKTYDAIGGHSAVRDKFVEDIHLARTAKAKGHRVRLVRAPDLTSTRMYTSLGALVRGWSRILYAGYDLSVIQLTAVLSGLLVFSLSAYVVLAAAGVNLLLGHPSSFVTTMFGMGIIHLLLQFSVMSRIYAITASQRAYVVFYGAAAGIMAWVIATALFKCFTHHIVWRGTDYRNLQETEPVILSLPAPDRKPVERPLKRTA